MADGTSVKDEQMGKIGPSFRDHSFIDDPFDFFGIVAFDRSQTVEQPFDMGINGESGDIKNIPQQHIGTFSADTGELSQLLHRLRDNAAETVKDHLCGSLKIF